MKMLQKSLSDEDTSLLEIEWSALEVDSEAAPDDSWVFVGASPTLKKSLAALFPSAVFVETLEEVALRPENKVAYVGALGESSLAGLDGAAQAVQKVAAMASDGAAPSLWLVTCATQPPAGAQAATTR